MIVLPALLLLQGSLQSCVSHSPSRPSYKSVKEYCICPQDKGDEGDVQWSNYLYTHMVKRAAHKNRVSTTAGKEAYKVYVDIDGTMSSDYCIRTVKDGISLQARNRESMTWLLYQFIATVGEDDSDFDVKDLPPSRVDMVNQSGSFAFEYRGLYSPSNTDVDLMGILSTQNVDYDWGLWGHNLRNVLSNPSIEGMYAQVGKSRNRSQFCFSSPDLYKQVEHYILENYGDGRKYSARFAILPNDNNLVCMCYDCRNAGNTEHNATPASSAFIARLAKRFPDHQFFMSSYITTVMPPKSRMPDNVGVIVSSIDLPMAMTNEENGQVKAFTALLNNWKSTVKNVYVWDYVRNFDDYYSPFPCLKVMQTRLSYYQKHGVRGIFLNGSGYDYASFEDLQTYVLAALMGDPASNVDKLIDKYFAINYPTAGAELAKFYKGMENKASGSGRVMQIYGGIEDAVGSFLDVNAFNELYNRLPALIHSAGPAETERLRRLYTALSFTRLEIARIPGGEEAAGKDVSAWLTQLAHYANYKEMRNNRESNPDIPAYLREWKSYLNGGKMNNRLKGLSASVWGASDVAYNSSQILTDGKPGYSCDWHTGWVISKSDEWGLRFPQSTLSKGGLLKVSFLVAPVWKLYPPKSVKIYADDKCVSTTPVSISEESTPYRRIEVRINVSPSQTNNIRVAFQRQSTPGAKVACDEVVWE